MIAARLIILATFLFGIVSAVPVRLAAEEADLPKTDDGLHYQPWFKMDSFLDLADDLAEAKAGGKRLAILFEQRGCPYCREMHKVNFKIPEVRDYIKANFDIVQVNLWGDREMTDFDGETLIEKKFGRKYRVQYTPTIIFPDDNGEEVHRLPGYFKPFHFKHIFMYVKEEGYIEQPNFQRWLSAKADELRAKGIEVKLW